MQRNKFRHLGRVCLLPVVCALAACVSPIESGIPVGEPVRLRPEARALRKAEITDLIVEAEHTIRDATFSTALIRQVSERSKRAVVSIYTKGTAPHRLRLLPIPIPGTGFRINLPSSALGSGFFIHESGWVFVHPG